MCWLVTIGVVNEGAASLARLVGRGLCASPDDQRESGFPSGISAFQLTSGGCSCDLYRPEPAQRSDERERSRLLERYRERGWSQAKIDRALASTRLPSDRAGAQRTTRLFDIVLALVDAHGSVHLYARDLSHERPAGAPRRMSIGELRDAGGAFPSDAPVEITR